MTDVAPISILPLDPFRLPRSALPVRYDVWLEPDLGAASFHGHVNVELDVVTGAGLAELVLNAIELDIHRCEINGRPAGHRTDDATQRLHVVPDEPLATGRHTLEIWFDGVLNDKLAGFYRSTYADSNGAEHVIATTQMQATDCRRCFPCWDEPDFKAVFGITLVVDPDHLVVSNSPEVSRAPHDGKVAVTFADTIPMSTYLVAFVVGPLEATDPIDVGGIPLRVVHVPGKGHLTQYALDVGAFALRWFQEYYGIAYPGVKVDMVAIPDFAAGAMENLGCITYRENLLLIDPTTSTQAERQHIADVVAHELAHMWFGDLVTMRWWNGIWLNEAFATFMELIACDAFRPDWERWTMFGLERSIAFETDSLSSTRSVEYEVRSPADCQGMFDVLTYQKGGALLRMLEQYLGPEQFRQGVSHYLRTHEYANTETSDLWDAVEVTTGEPVRRIMDSWIWQPGFPLVTASLDGSSLVLRQMPFVFEDDVAGAEPNTTSWAIPIVVRHGGGEDAVLLDGDEARLELSDQSTAVVVNAGGHGFYRVAYDAALLTRLAAGRGDLGTLERYNLLDDAWNAVVAGSMDAVAYLELVEHFGDEPEFAVWQSIVTGLRGLGRLLDEEYDAAFQARVRALVGPALTRLGDPTPDEGDLTRKLRGLLTGALAVLGADEPTQQRCRELFDLAAADPTAVDAELTVAATSVVAACGDDETYERLLAAFRHADTPQDELRFLYALAEFDDADLVRRTCELAMSREVKTQNAPFLLRHCIANRHHGAASWAFVRAHWPEAVQRFPSNTLSRMVEAVKLLNRPTDVADVAAFFAEHPIPQAAKTLEQTLERQRVNAALRERAGAGLATAL